MRNYLLLISIIFFVACSNKEQQKKNVEIEENINLNIDTILINKTHKNSTQDILEKKEVPILCYHKIDNENTGTYTVSENTLKSHLQILADSGYQSILPNQLYEYLVYNAPVPEKSFIITFDDSRKEHYEIAAPILESYGFRGAFFIMTITYNKKNYMSTEQIAELHQRGHSIGLHSWDHTMVTKYDSIAWEKQVIKPKAKLEEIIQAPVEYWAHPNGVYNHVAAKELNEHFKISFALMSKRDSIYPLQGVRRMIVPNYKAERLINSMKQQF